MLQFLFMVSLSYNDNVPLRAASTKVASKPFLLIVRSAEVETFNETQTPSDSKKNLLVFKFGKNLRLVLLLACDTLLPTCVLLPVI
jgi:hypothetical protein